MEVSLKRSDSQLEQEVWRALRQDPVAPKTGIYVAVKGGVIKLTGQAADETGRVAAQRIAHLIPGGLDVVNEIDVLLAGSTIERDTHLAREIRQVLMLDAPAVEDRIQSTVSHGWVILEGTVNTWQERKQIEEYIRQLTGVRGVDNRTAVHPAPFLRPDLHSLVRLALEEVAEREADREAAEIEVTNEADVVTVSGWIRSGVERVAILKVLSQTPGVRLVKDKLKLEPEW